MPLSYIYLDPEKILDSDDFKIVEYFLKHTNRMGIGWHYIIDLTWVYSLAKNWPTSYRILDAGGGRGPTQFLLAEMGFDVTNIDLFHFTPHDVQKQRYQLYKRQLESYVTSDYVEHLEAFRGPLQSIKVIVRGLIKMPVFKSISNVVYGRMHTNWRDRYGYQDRRIGKIEWVVGNLCNMPEYQDSSFDAVVSLSALEHIPIDLLPSALSEINRIVKLDGAWAVTTSGTNQRESWYHEPSKGNCFSESDFERLFGATLKGGIDVDAAIEKYQNCDYLKRNLASFYKKSGDNGMPFGVWDPKYIPVGLFNK